jgi:hypothetical protein
MMISREKPERLGERISAEPFDLTLNHQELKPRRSGEKPTRNFLSYRRVTQVNMAVLWSHGKNISAAVRV